MKNIFNGLCLSLLLVAAGACSKDENRIYSEGGTAPVLAANVSTAIPLSFATQENQALKLTWTNPDYRFTTGTSSQTVLYQIEIDTTGANFTNPKRQTVSVSGGLERSFLQSELNDYLLNQLELVGDMPHNIEIRVKASLASGALLLTSNVLKFTTTPYKIPPKVTPPASGALYVTGGATPAGWQCGCPSDVAPANQTFTKMSETVYVLNNIPLKGGESYLLLPVYGSWDAKFGFTGSNNENNVDGDTFKAGGGDIKAPASGNYKIEVNFQTGRFTLTKL
jgi:starch-binding outer membrane protein SusE/F